MKWQHRTIRRYSCVTPFARSCRTLLEAVVLVVVVILFAANTACVDHSADRGAGLSGGRSAFFICWAFRLTPEFVPGWCWRSVSSWTMPLMVVKTSSETSKRGLRRWQQRIRRCVKSPGPIIAIAGAVRGVRADGVSFEELQVSSTSSLR